jgi:hypothetical protein
MATVSPITSVVDGIPRVTWADIVTGDTITSLPVPGRKLTPASVQIGGTFGGATVKLQVSNDNTTFYDLKDTSGTTVSATSGAIFELSSSAAYFKPSLTSGSANAVDITLILRG